MEGRLDDLDTCSIKDAETACSVISSITHRSWFHPCLILNAAQGYDRRGALTARVRSARVLIADFDGTIHPGNQWMVIRRRLRERGRADLADRGAREAEAYFASGRRSPRDDGDFLRRSVRRMEEADFTRRCLMAVAQDEELRCRPGADRLVALFQKRVFISFGLSDVLSYYARSRFGIHVDALAAGLDYCEGDFLKGVTEGTIVVPATKLHWALRYCNARRVPLEHCLVLGDEPADCEMGNGRACSVLVFPIKDMSEERLRKRLRDIADHWPAISAILVTDDEHGLHPLSWMRSTYS